MKTCPECATGNMELGSIKWFADDCYLSKGKTIEYWYSCRNRECFCEANDIHTENSLIYKLYMNLIQDIENYEESVYNRFFKLYRKGE